MRTVLFSLCTAAALSGCNCGGPGVRGQPLLSVSLGKSSTDGRTLNFGAVNVGQKKTLTLTVDNVGSVDFIPSVGAITGDALAFVVTPTGDLPILVSQKGTTLSVTFSPTVVRAYSGQFSVTCAGCVEQVVNLAGAGSGDCEVTLLQSTLVFPSAAGGQVKTLDLTINNTGLNDCHLSIKLDPQSDPAFALPKGAVTGRLKVGALFKPTVSFTAPSGGALGHNGFLLLDSDDPKNPHRKIPLVASNEDAGYATTPWPKWHRTSTNSGLSFVDTSGFKGSLVWKHNIGSQAKSVDPDAIYLASPSIGVGGVIYQMGFGTSLTQQGSFVALQPDGSEKWRVRLTSPEPTCAESTATVAADGDIYLMTGGDGVSGHGGHGSAEFFHLAAADGHTIWSTQNSDDGFDSSPALGPDGTLYVIVDDNQTVQAYKNDKLLWNGTVSLSWPETFSGALRGDGTSFWSAQGEASALSADGSRELWHVALGSGGGGLFGASGGKAAPALGPDGTVYVAVDDTGTTVTAYALDPATGNAKWSAAGSGTGNGGGGFGGFGASGGYSSPALTPEGGIVVGGPAGMHSFVNGKEHWRFPCGAVYSSPAVGADSTVFFGSTDGNFYAVDANGKLRAKYNVGAAVNSSPAIGGDGTIYVMADDGNLYAFR